MRFLSKLFGSRKPETISEKPDPLKKEPAKPLVHASYPPRHDGIPIATAVEMVQAQAELMRRLKLHAAALKGQFRERFEIPVENLAEYISNIPASKDSIYGGPGGLYRACLECAFFSYQASDGKIFTGQLGVEDRHLLEKRWRYTCFMSGLMFPIGQTLEKIRVTDDAGAGWLIRAESISRWADKVGTGHYYVGWPREDVEPGPSVLGGALTIQIAGVESIRYLEEGSAALTTAYTEISSGIRTDFNAIAYDLVQSMWERLKKNEMARLPQNYGRVQFGQHNAPIIVDAMRECLSSGAWAVNKNAVLADKTGVYLVWPRAAKDLLESAKITSLKGMPSTPTGLLQVMVDEKMVHVDAQQSAFVDVADADGELHLAVKLVKPDSCVEGYNPSDYVAAVVAQEIAKTDPLVEESLKGKQKTSEAVVDVAEPAKAAGDAKSRVIPAAPPPAADVLMATLGSPAAVKEKEPAIAPAAAPEPPPAPAIVPTPTPATPTSSPATTNADPEAKAGYTVPEDVVRQMRKPFALMLERVMQELKKQEYSVLIITINPEYVAIPYEAVAKAITAPSDLLIALQKLGWLHPDPSKPRAMVHNLSVTPGGTAKAQYVMFSRGFVKKAKLPI